MAKRIYAPVAPALLIWAREAVHLSLEDVAHKTRLDLETLTSWEAGHGHPTIPQLRKLGEIYKRPIAVFFLAEPPSDFSPQREFRRLAGITPGKESPALLHAIRTAAFQRQAAIELTELLGDEDSVPDLPLQLSEDPEQAGPAMRETLGIAWNQQLDWNNAHSALNAWRTAIEVHSILVFQTGSVAVSEMRGTCIPDRPFPTIILNSKDAPHGRVFSLLHEYAHIDAHEEIWIQEGPLFEALRASMSIPTVLTPAMIDGRHLVDGGLTNPLPIDPTLHDHTDLTIAVDLSGKAAPIPATPADAEMTGNESGRRERIAAFVADLQERLRKDHPGSTKTGERPKAFDLVSHSIETMQYTITALKLDASPPDHLITVPRNTCSFYEFHRAGELIDLGYRLAGEKLAAAV